MYVLLWLWLWCRPQQSNRPAYFKKFINIKGSKYSNKCISQTCIKGFTPLLSPRSPTHFFKLSHKNLGGPRPLRFWKLDPLLNFNPYAPLLQFNVPISKNWDFFWNCHIKMRFWKLGPTLISTLMHVWDKYWLQSFISTILKNFPIW